MFLIAKNMILESNFQVINHKNKHFGDQKLGFDDNLKLNFVYKCHFLGVKMCTNHDKVGNLGN